MEIALDTPVLLQATVLDLAGREVWQSNAVYAEKWVESIDLSAYPPGLYLVRLRVDGRSITRKLVKH